MASGRPSTRPTDLRDVFGAGVVAEAGSWACARSSNRATASRAPRCDGVAHLGLDGERLAARRDRRERGACGDQLSDERRGAEDVLEVVDDQQQVLDGQEARDRLLGDSPESATIPRAVTMACATSS
jgi:hypothetical protein